jgi:hypothetical protein
MRIKRWRSRLKQLAYKLLDLMAARSVPMQKGNDDNWWQYYVGYFE